MGLDAKYFSDVDYDSEMVGLNGLLSGNHGSGGSSMRAAQRMTTVQGETVTAEGEKVAVKSD